MTRPKFLVTDATGATGTAAAEELLQRGHDVRALAHRHDGRSNHVFAGTNKVVEEIGGKPPLAVEAFLAKHRHAFA